MISMLRVLFPIIVLLVTSHVQADFQSVLEKSFNALNSAKHDFNASKPSATSTSIMDLSGKKSIFATDFSTIEFDFKITPPSYTHKTQTIDNPSNPTGPSIDFIMDSPSEYVTWMAYKCERAKAKALDSASNPAISVNLSAAIDQMLDGVTKMETDLKSSIASNISGFFSAVQSYFRPEYVMSEALKLMTNTFAEVSCASCKKTLVGCDNVFLLSKAYKDNAENFISDSYDPSKTTEKITINESGSIIDVGFAGCPTVSLLSMPTGIAAIYKNKTKKQAREYISAHIESIKNELDADAMKMCISSQTEYMKGFFKDVLNTATAGIKAEVEAQNQCLNENSNGLSLSLKNSQIMNETVRGYFDSYNMFIAGDANDENVNGVNGIAQKFTGSILDKIYNKIDIVNTGVIPDKGSSTLEPSKVAFDAIMEPHIGDHPNSSVQSILDYSIDLISSQASSSLSKGIAFSMANQIANAFNLKHQYMVEFTKDYGLITATDIEPSFDFISTKNTLLSELTAYEDLLIQEISFNPIRPAPFLACSSFDTKDMDNPKNLPEHILVNKCFLERKIQRFSDIDSYTPTCSCTDFGRLMDVFANPISKRDYFISTLPQKFDLPADTSSVPWKRQFTHLLIDTKLKYLKGFTESLLRIQTDSERHLVQMSVVEMTEVKRLFRMTLKNFNL